MAKFLQGSTQMTFFLLKFLTKEPSLLPISKNKFWVINTKNFF
jgi:hypothetical protein